MLCLGACAHRPDGDSIDIPPPRLAAAGDDGDGPSSSGGSGSGPGGEAASSPDAVAARQPDYRPLPDAPGMQLISSGYDPNASDDDAAQKEDGKHYVVPDTQVSYGPHSGRQSGYGH
ncbi:hypothetical protein HLH34_06225 [Gluconacetobacter azotocaptans]|uniref:Uncharacterized protein n=1 Tax=Gluconacetobacter azotocaptans TaxID=142834 RepID=A0A7W4JRG7_9PROT|nr:hypothetical protein [Gluconacetobacter azotocaptans]MBM9403532.1 hypothetical protein [Gluconacetobacter azotocaptans]